MSGIMVGHNLIESLSQLNDQQRLTFYESFAHKLTIANRAIWSNEETADRAKVERLKNINEIMHRVAQAIHVVRVTPSGWSYEHMVGEICRWVSRDESIAGDVGWAFQKSIEWALESDGREFPAAPKQSDG
jgi:hypothetical protein